MTDLFALNLFMLKVAGEGTGRGRIDNAASTASQVVAGDRTLVEFQVDQRSAIVLLL